MKKMLTALALLSLTVVAPAQERDGYRHLDALTAPASNAKPWTTIEGEVFRRQLTLGSEYRKTKFVRCTFETEDFYNVWIDDGCSQIIFEDCDFKNAQKKNIVGHSFAVTKSRFHAAGNDAIFTSGGNVLVRSNVFYDGYGWDIGAHADPMQVMIGENILIEHNEVHAVHQPWKDGLVANSCVYIEPDFGPVRNVIIRGNKFDGGLYSVWCIDGGKGLPKNVTMYGNSYGRHYYGAARVDESPLIHFLDDTTGSSRHREGDEQPDPWN